jgi:hypothetical protein
MEEITQIHQKKNLKSKFQDLYDKF